MFALAAMIELYARISGTPSVVTRYNMDKIVLDREFSPYKAYWDLD
jgi:hypothetical protein